MNNIIIMFGFYNYNANNLKIKVDCLIYDNIKINSEIKQLNKSIKKLKNDDNMKDIKNNIDELKKEIITIQLKNDYYINNIKTVIDVLKNEINAIKLKNNCINNDINNDDFIQI